MIKAGAEELRVQGAGLIPLLFDRSKICIDRPLRCDLGKLFLSDERTAIGNTFVHQALCDQLPRLQRRQEDERAEQKKRRCRHKDGDRDQSAEILNSRKQYSGSLLSEIESDHAIHDEVPQKRP
ncbi:hypothetical protein [Mesorhizobium sp.]|uniref:hypothetical protein n=1 Tax=Mesorhizobium sp. TaxID=1871066 RepID=UPI00257FAE3D|nr:hypothetical protein [Mesorhizobium sp.]